MAIQSPSTFSVEDKPELVTIVGTCMDMCPRHERLMREREGLLHEFECAEDFKFSETQSRKNALTNRARKAFRKGDPEKVVKAFARSAAGIDKTRPEDLRPAHILENTVEYLCLLILPRNDVTFITIYDFVFDRLRSVRQDLVIQRINNSSTIRILETVIRFHVYSAFRLRHESISKFDPIINMKHLLDTLERLTWMYEAQNYKEQSRFEFETMYLLLKPDSSTARQRALKLRQNLAFRTNAMLAHALEISLAYQNRNYRKYFKTLKLLPQLVASCAFLQAKIIRGKAFQSISKAYGVTNCKYPLDVLKSTLHYVTESDIEHDLHNLNIPIVNCPDINKRCVKFNKNMEFTPSQLDCLNCDFDFLLGTNNLFDPSQVGEAIRVIWPFARSQALLPSQKKTEDWFEG